VIDGVIVVGDNEAVAMACRHLSTDLCHDLEQPLREEGRA
jgi:hypothetical protein